MGLEKHQNEAPGYESQEDTKNHEKVWSKDKGEKKEPLQTHDEEKYGTSDI